MQGRTSLEPEAPPLEPRDCVFFLRGREWKRRWRSGLDFFEGAEGGEARESDFEKKKKKTGGRRRANYCLSPSRFMFPASPYLTQSLTAAHERAPHWREEGCLVRMREREKGGVLM